MLFIKAKNHYKEANIGREPIIDGKDFFQALYDSGFIDDTDFENILSYLKSIRRNDLLHIVHSSQLRSTAP